VRAEHQSGLAVADHHLFPVCQHAMQDKTSLLDEKWDGSDEEELACFVTEVSRVLVPLLASITLTAWFAVVLYPLKDHDSG
jgi:hypothetical protein